MKKFVDSGEYFILSSFRITKVPYSDNEKAILDLSKAICEDSCYISSEGNGQTSVELLRLARIGIGSIIEHYITFRTHDSSEQDCVVRHEAMVRGTSSNLRQKGYIFEEITYGDYKTRLSEMNSGNVWALKKQDIIETGIQGTYRAPSVVKSVDWKKIYVALNGSGCGLCIQIISSLLTDNERNQIKKNLASSTQAVNGIMPNMHDQLAISSAERWKYYSQTLGRPFAEVNILISGSVPEVAIISARIKQSVGDTPFSSVQLSEYDKYSIYNQPWKIALAIRNTGEVCLGKWSSDEVSHIFRFPTQEKYYIGAEINPFSLIPETFLISERMKDSDRSIHLGKSIHTSHDIAIPIEQFLLHTGIMGMTGAGKSTLLKQITTGFHRLGIPVLIMEPVKKEYRDLISGMDNSRIYTVEKSITPLLINPFCVPHGVSLGEYKGSLLSAFKAAFSLPDPLPSLLAKAITEAYLQNGWSDTSTSSDANVTVFDMAEFIRVLRRVIERSTYSNEVKGNMMSGGAFRLQSLLERCPHTFDTIHSTSIEDILTGCTVLEMGSLEPEQKSLVSALMLISILAYLKATRVSENSLKNILLIDEAHAILDQGEGATDEEKALNSTMTQLMINVITEMRAYGVGVIFSDQSPSRIGRKLIDNVDNIISFRLHGEEAEMLGSLIGMEDRERRVLSMMSVGEFVVKNHILKSALAVSMDYSEESDIREHVSDETIANQQSEYLFSHANDYLPFLVCEKSGCKSCSATIREEANMLALQIFNGRQDHLSTPENIASHIMKLPTVLSTRRKNDAAFNTLCKCVAIHLIRKCSSEKNISLGQDAIVKLLDDLQATLS